MGSNLERQDDGSLPRDNDASVGADVKWEVRSGLVLDLTANPDFAQVEADDQVVNLTRFDLFLPEKREFFLENAGVFEFGARGLFETPPFLLFFSRNIGIKEDEGEVPVLGGVRLSGRAGRQTVGFLSVLQDEAFGDPRTNFGALRVKRDVGANGFVGAMLTDRRTRDGAETDGGLDFSLWPTRRLNLTGFAALTSAAGDRGSDKAYRLGAEYRTSHLSLRGQHLLVGPDAETGMGFVTRTDIRRTDSNFRWTFRPQRHGLRAIEVYGGGSWITRTTGEEQDGEGYLGGAAQSESGDRISGFLTHGFTVLDETFDLADRVPVPVGRYDRDSLTLFLRSSPSRPLESLRRAELGPRVGRLGRLGLARHAPRRRVSPRRRAELDAQPRRSPGRCIHRGRARPAARLGLLDPARGARLPPVQQPRREVDHQSPPQLHPPARQRPVPGLQRRPGRGRRARPAREPRLRGEGDLARSVLTPRRSPGCRMRADKQRAASTAGLRRRFGTSRSGFVSPR